ncbi:uncharacterized protein LOC124280344 isoform X1 [Haliotis rubra]|uniref:uncharacterized protein LOC124280344 isoform X1 n=2 Tax=Haliotis rubra TaxID=36100 RepID=UPI001EE5132C|nr:uncharacterized protein LOC124280344 isoform X1 [Haliotis rubra]
MLLMMFGARGDWLKEWQHYVKGLVLFVGILYTSYVLFFAYLRLNSSSWDARPTPMSEFMWRGDVGLEDVHSHVMKGHLSDDVTIITAYFNLGKFTKGIGYSYTPRLYTQWMQVFARLNNPLVVFTDSQDVYNHFVKLRQNFSSNQSKIILLERRKLWSFSLAGEIRDIYRQQHYPKYHPNTVNENYSCVMHAKFELVNKVIREQLYKTKYLSWLDIGLFRDIADEGTEFHIQTPPFWDENKVAYSEVHDFDATLTPVEVILQNLVWVSGAMFLGRPEVLYMYTKDYMKAVRMLLDRSLMNTDQQVIYSMYLPSFNFKPHVDIQTYTTHSSGDWFYLGYLIKDRSDIKKREMMPLVRFFLSYL